MNVWFDDNADWVRDQKTRVESDKGWTTRGWQLVCSNAQHGAGQEVRTRTAIKPMLMDKLPRSVCDIILTVS